MANANAIVNRTNRTITITKAYNAKASIYGTIEYDTLTKIQSQNPGFRVVVQPSTRKSVPLGKITYAQMEKYIKSHDDDKKSIWNEYLKLRGKTEEDEDENENEDEIRVKVSVTFFEVKKWFANKYPHFTKEAKELKKEIKKIMEKETN